MTRVDERACLRVGADKPFCLIVKMAVLFMAHLTVVISSLMALTSVASALQFTLTGPTRGFTSIASTGSLINFDSQQGIAQLTLSPFPDMGLSTDSGGSVVVTRNGNVKLSQDLVMDGVSCLCPAGKTSASPVHIAVMHCPDLDPNVGAAYLLCTPASCVISFEGMTIPGFTGSLINAQMELFVNGNFELRYGTGNTAGATCAAGFEDPGFLPSSSVFYPAPLAPCDTSGLCSGFPSEAGVLYGALLGIGACDWCFVLYVVCHPLKVSQQCVYYICFGGILLFSPFLDSCCR